VFIGLPSGFPGTAVFNSKINEYYFKCAYLELARRDGRWKHYSLDSYRENVRNKFYGDDNINSFSPAVRTWFNMITFRDYMQELGHEVTPAIKDGVMQPWMRLDELSFLKKGFKVHPVFKDVYVDPIEPYVIHELTNWVRDDQVSFLYDNIRDSLEFAYSHGQDFYTKHLTTVNNALLSKKLDPVNISYHAWDCAHLTNCGKVICPPTTRFRMFHETAYMPESAMFPKMPYIQEAMYLDKTMCLKCCEHCTRSFLKFPKAKRAVCYACAPFNSLGEIQPEGFTSFLLGNYEDDLEGFNYWAEWTKEHHGLVNKTCWCGTPFMTVLDDPINSKRVKCYECVPYSSFECDF
jgi:hypothetical protein